MPVTFGKEMFDKEFLLDGNLTLINHGSFGACAKRVHEARLRLMTELEACPDRWYRWKSKEYWDENIKAAAQFVGADPNNLVFVENTTKGINSVMKSWPLKADDAILLYSWQYKSMTNTCEMLARMCGVKTIVQKVKTPINSKNDVINLYKEALEKHPNIKITIIELICSPTGTLQPIVEIAKLCKKYDVAVVVDGAHGIGHVPLNLEELGASGIDCFTGNVHKWTFAPRGCAVLWMHPRLHHIIRPAVTSTPANISKPGPNFAKQGTRDDTPFFVVKDAINFYNEIGGMEAITKHNTALLDQAVEHLVQTWGTLKFPVPREMEAPFMKLVQLPVMKRYPLEEEPCPESEIKACYGDLVTLQRDLFEKHGVVAFVCYIDGVPYTRLSAHVYNTLDDYKRFADVISQYMNE